VKKLFPALVLCFIAAASAFGQVVITTSDYESGNTAVYDIKTGALLDSVLPHHHDTSVHTDGEYAYILEGFGKNSIIKYNSSPIFSGNPVVYQYSVSPDGTETNPHDIVFAEEKAYLILNGSDRIWVVDPNAADAESFELGRIDISAWADADGCPEAHMGFLYKETVFVVLQRYNLNTYTAGAAVLIGIDTATDTLVDFDGAKDGVQGIELIVKNPQKGRLYGGILYLGGTTYGASDEGVMSIDLDNPAAPESQVKIIGEAELGGLCAGVLHAENGRIIIGVLDENWSTKAFALTGDALTPLPVPDAGGGLVRVGEYFYVGSRDYSGPGIYILRADSLTVVGDRCPTSLPPLSMAYVGASETTLVESDDAAPLPFSVEAPFPNPFNPSTTLSFHLAGPGRVTVDVYNTAGQLVERLLDGALDAGQHSITWNAVNRATGTYLLRVGYGGRTHTEKATLVK